ncbi:hypothetical protein K4F52_000254 [Lecanicillium sp. MT-2017a]|nr:hypothetical protein K4F52_000254 [Lecanicillium sp. MT-2017a]
MDVTDFKGPAPEGESRAVASSNSGHRQTVPTSAEESAEQEELAPAPIHDQPPPYDPASAPAPAANNTSTSTATPAQNDDAPTETTRSSRHSSRSRTSGVNQEGYQSTENMTWEQKDASGYWDRP